MHCFLGLDITHGYNGGLQTYTLQTRGYCFIYSLKVNLSREINLIHHRKYDISIIMLIYTHIIIHVFLYVTIYSYSSI